MFYCRNATQRRQHLEQPHSMSKQASLT